MHFLMLERKVGRYLGPPLGDMFGAGEDKDFLREAASPERFRSCNFCHFLTFSVQGDSFTNFSLHYGRWLSPQWTNVCNVCNWLWGTCMSKSFPNFSRIRWSMWIQRSKKWYFDGGVAVTASDLSAPCGPNVTNFFLDAGGGACLKTLQILPESDQVCEHSSQKKPEKHYSWLCTLFKTLICPDNFRVVYGSMNTPGCGPSFVWGLQRVSPKTHVLVLYNLW